MKTSNPDFWLDLSWVITRHFWVLEFLQVSSQDTDKPLKWVLGLCHRHTHTLLSCQNFPVPSVSPHSQFGGQNKPELFWRHQEQEHDLSPILGYNFTTGCCCCDMRARRSSTNWELDVKVTFEVTFFVKWLTLYTNAGNLLSEPVGTLLFTLRG